MKCRSPSLFRRRNNKSVEQHIPRQGFRLASSLSQPMLIHRPTNKKSPLSHILSLYILFSQLGTGHRGSHDQDTITKVLHTGLSENLINTGTINIRGVLPPWPNVRSIRWGVTSWQERVVSGKWQFVICIQSWDQYIWQSNIPITNTRTSPQSGRCLGRQKYIRERSFSVTSTGW